MVSLTVIHKDSMGVYAFIDTQHHFRKKQIGDYVMSSVNMPENVLGSSGFLYVRGQMSKSDFIILRFRHNQMDIVKELVDRIKEEL